MSRSCGRTPCVSRTSELAPPSSATAAVSQNFQSKAEEVEKFLLSECVNFNSCSHTGVIVRPPGAGARFRLCLLSLGQGPNPIKLEQAQRRLAPRSPPPHTRFQPTPISEKSPHWSRSSPLSDLPELIIQTGCERQNTPGKLRCHVRRYWCV